MQGQQVPARRALSPSQRPLLRSGGNISCQDLSSPGCSSVSEMAAADTLLSALPVASWQALPFLSIQPNVPIPNTPLREALGWIREGEWPQWQWAELAAPSQRCEKYPGWLIDSAELGKSLHASHICPNLSCFATCPLKKNMDLTAIKLSGGCCCLF